MIPIIKPDWVVPSNVKALTTTRIGGVSQPPFDAFNLATHVNDDIDRVMKNRQQLQSEFNLPDALFWLNQTHSTDVITLNELNPSQVYDADASYTDNPNLVSIVMTADCLPVIFTNTKGDEVASAHAGWRGLCHGILENSVQQFKCSQNEIIAWLGPAIGPKVFEVGEEVRDAFMAIDKNADLAFTPTKEGKFLANLYLLARQRLERLGIQSIFGGDYCTYTQSEQFYSYRRQAKTGRMATLIWFDE